MLYCTATLGIEERGCCKEVAVVERFKQVSMYRLSAKYGRCREVAVRRSSTVTSETQTFNPYTFPLFLDIAFLAFALSIIVTFLMFSAFALWKISTKRYRDLGQSVKMKHCRMKNHWRRTLLSPGKLVALSSPWINPLGLNIHIQILQTDIRTFL